MKKTLAVLLFAVLASTPASAQAVAGMGIISGSVRDNSGAAIDSAEIVIENTAKGIRRVLASNEAGQFSAPSLVPSSGYTVTVRKSGFAPHESRNLDLRVGQNLAFDVVLHVAGTVLQVEVETQAPLVETTRMDVSQVIQSSQIENLPLSLIHI